jgi:hypothetical protein
MSIKNYIEQWVSDANSDELREAIKHMVDGSLESAILLYQYASSHPFVTSVTPTEGYVI